MLKITSFSALIAGLLLAMPMVFSSAEAGRMDTMEQTAKSDRESLDRLLDNRLAEAFKMVDLCSSGVDGHAGSGCRGRHDELARSGDVSTAVNMVTVESRDEAARTSTLAAIPLNAK